MAITRTKDKSRFRWFSFIYSLDFFTIDYLPRICYNVPKLNLLGGVGMRTDQMRWRLICGRKTQHGTESFPFQYYADALYRYDNQFVPQHWHSELEFVIAYGGEIEIPGVEPAGETEKWRRGILINANVLHSYQQIHPEINAFARTSFWGRTNRTDCKYCPRKIWTDYSGRNHALYCLGAWDSVAERNTCPSRYHLLPEPALWKIGIV